MAAAGAKAGEAAAPAGGGIDYRLKRLGTRPARRRRRFVVMMATVALLAAGGAALASFSQPARHAGRAGAAPSRVPVRPRASARPSAMPARPAPTASPRRSPSAAPSPRGRGTAASLEVAGVGCPGGGEAAVTVDDAPKGPGWMSAGGGWTGNGCDGSTLWTMDPNGKPGPSSLTWIFSPVAGTARCTLAVFIPTQNALGVSDYSVSIGPMGTGQVVAAVPVSQAAKAGQWLMLGTFTVSGSSVEITTAPVPGASGPGHHGAIAASAASARCT